MGRLEGLRLLTVKAVAAFLLAWTLVSLLVNFPKHVRHEERNEVGGFPLLAQPDHITCGPTSATMLLNWYGKDVTVSQVERRAKTRWFHWKGSDFGMTAPDCLASAMTELGVPATMRVSSLEMVKWLVDQDRPPIVLLRSGVQTWHYVVVIGYDPQNIVIANPGGGVREAMSVSVFQGAWGFTCDMNGGKPGLAVDIYAEALRMADIRPNTIIVARSSRSHGE